MRSYNYYLGKNIAQPCFTGKPKEIFALQTQFAASIFAYELEKAMDFEILPQ